MKALAMQLLILLFIFVADAESVNLKLFRDPRDVSLKNHKPCSTTASRCEPPDTNLLEEQGFLQSENGEDRCLIENYFSGVCEGRYLEVGALDGIQSSNTYAFYKVLGWKGVNIEIDPDNYEDLTYNRRDDLANVHAAVCSDSQKTIHYAIGRQDFGRGGIWEFSSEAHRAKHWTNMTLYNTISMKCTPLQPIFDRIFGTRKVHFDLATFDLEGADFSALLGIDFTRITFGVLIIERNEDGNTNQQIEDLLLSKGYSIPNVQSQCPTVGNDNLWFVHSNFHNIYSQMR